MYLEAGDDEAEAFVLAVAGPHLPVEQIAQWLADHCRTGPSMVG